MARIVNATTVTVLTVYGSSVDTVLGLKYWDPFPAVAVPYSLVHVMKTGCRGHLTFHRVVLDSS